MKSLPREKVNCRVKEGARHREGEKGRIKKGTLREAQRQSVYL